MVHALREAWRVLEPDGLLVDLRPATVHRRIGVLHGTRRREVGATRETFANETAANHAVAEVVADGLFLHESRERCACLRKMDSLAEFRAWLDEFVRLEGLPSHDWLFERVKRALQSDRGNKRIVVSAPLELHVLKKAEASR